MKNIHVSSKQENYIFSLRCEHTNKSLEIISVCKFHYSPQDFGTVVVVFHGVFDKTKAVDVTDKRVAVGSEQVEPTNCLLRSETRQGWRASSCATTKLDKCHTPLKKITFHDNAIFLS